MKVFKLGNAKFIREYRLKGNVCFPLKIHCYKARCVIRLDVWLLRSTKNNKGTLHQRHPSTISIQSPNARWLFCIEIVRCVYSRCLASPWKDDLYPSVCLTRNAPIQLRHGEELRAFFFPFFKIFGNMENILHGNFRRKTYSSAPFLARLVLTFDKWQTHFINQPWAGPATDPAWAPLWAGSSFPRGQISFSRLNPVEILRH